MTCTYSPVQFKTGPDINVVNLLPVLMDEYFHYHGSLTTGGCEESVNWVVFKNPLAIKATDSDDT